MKTVDKKNIKPLIYYLIVWAIASILQIVFAVKKDNRFLIAFASIHIVNIAVFGYVVLIKKKNKEVNKKVK